MTTPRIKVETVTLHDGSKMDVIRDVEAVERLIEAGNELHKRLQAWCKFIGGPPNEDNRAVDQWEKVTGQKEDKQ